MAMCARACIPHAAQPQDPFWGCLGTLRPLHFWACCGLLEWYPRHVEYVCDCFVSICTHLSR